MSFKTVLRRLRWPLARRSTVERLTAEVEKFRELCRVLERRSSHAAINAAMWNSEAVRQHERARKVARN